MLCFTISSATVTCSIFNKYSIELFFCSISMTTWCSSVSSQGSCANNSNVIFLYSKPACFHTPPGALTANFSLQNRHHDFLRSFDVKSSIFIRKRSSIISVVKQFSGLLHLAQFSLTALFSAFSIWECSRFCNLIGENIGYKFISGIQKTKQPVGTREFIPPEVSRVISIAEMLSHYSWWPVCTITDEAVDFRSGNCNFEVSGGSIVPLSRGETTDVSSDTTRNGERMPIKRATL